MIPKLFFSQALDVLVDRLIQELDAQSDLMHVQIILVPNSQMKQWLLLEIARRKGIAMGMKIVEPAQFFPSSRTPLERYCSIYTALGNSNNPELISYLEGKKKRHLELTSTLCSLFVKYEKHASMLDGEKNWQTEMLPKPQVFETSEPIICFGLDYIPSFKTPALSIYQFSPCIEFWEDICSDRERKKLKRAWKGKEELVDTYLREGPRNLANWGRLGRMALKELDDFEAEELYLPIEPVTLLKQIQYDLLHFQETKEPKIDSSIQILQTGSSRLAEIEALKEEILRLDVSYSEISVLAPNIEPYVPLIEYVFGEDIPYRIAGTECPSSFRQGLLRLLQMSRWDAEEILALFETPSFYRKRGWDAETLETFREWIEKANIEWGWDAAHRKEVLQGTFENIEPSTDHSWEKGLDTLLETLIYLKPIQINPDLFEELLTTLFALKELDLKGKKTLPEWADAIEKAADEFLLPDLEDAFQSRFVNLLLEMRKSIDLTQFPVDIAKHFLSAPACGQINGSKLHAIRFGPIEEGALLPATALFLIGMDEMSFPRIAPPSSLDLLKGKIPSQGDFDRYAFLQAIFAAKEVLRISYGHLSPEEGKPVSPSLIVQELIAVTGPSIVKSYRPPKPQHAVKRLIFPKFTPATLPEGEITLSIQDLRRLARHPWKFFLQSKHKIFLNEELEESFALQKASLIRNETVDLPTPFQKALQSEALEKINERKAQLESWQIEPAPLSLNLELCWEKLKVKLVGEIKTASLKGLISLNEDNIGGTLKIWPEALAASIVHDAPQIWMMRNGKIKTVNQPLEKLKAFIEYYFHCLQAPSPLLPEWADSILRKRDFSDLDARFEDPIMDWVLARAELPPLDEWEPLLQSTFQGLIDLYPTRGSEKTLNTPRKAPLQN